MAGKHDGDWDDSALLAHLEEADSGKESTAVELRLAALEREVAALKAEVATLKNSGGRAHATAGVAQPAAKQPRIDSSLTTAAPGASSSFFPTPSTGTARHQDQCRRSSYRSISELPSAPIRTQTSWTFARRTWIKLARYVRRGVLFSY